MSVQVERVVTSLGQNLQIALEKGGCLNNNLVGKVGWFRGHYYVDDRGRQTPVAEVAARNEFGNPAKNQPPRPFIRSAIKKNRKKWLEIARKGATDAILGKNKNPEHIMELVGLVAASDVKDSINELQSPPLSPRTIAARITKKKKGHRLFAAVTKPLIESGIMLKTLTNIVENE